MTEILSKTPEPCEPRENPNGFCLIRVELDEDGAPVDWTFLHVNDAITRLDGRTREELIGHRFYEVFPEASVKWLRPCYDAAYRGISSSVDEISEEINCFLHMEVYPVGEPGCCACVLSDIQERIHEQTRNREELEGAIRELEQEKRVNLQVREYAQAMGMVYPLAVGLDYRENRFQLVESDHFINRFPSTLETVDDLVHYVAQRIPDEEARAQFLERFGKKSVLRAFSEGRSELRLRHPQTGDDGRTHYMDTRLVLLNCSETRAEVLSLTRCIDDELELDRALELEAQNTRVISSLSTIYTTILEVDVRTHFYRVVKSVDLMKTAMNGAASGNYDTVAESVLRYFMHPDFRDEMRKYLNIDTFAPRMAQTDTIITEYMDPKGRWFESRFIAHKRDEFGELLSVLYVARDITREKQKELSYRTQLKRAAEEAERANLSKTNFLRRMSHDIRTPLNGIIGMLHIAEKNRDDRDKVDECHRKILHSTDYLLNLINNVLDISKLESGSIQLENKPFDLEEMLRNALPAAESTALESGLHFLGGLEESRIRHRYLIGSPVHLNRVLMNLASNAVKYNRPGGSVRLTCNELSADEDRATFEFICEDTGLGMSEEFQKHAFEPFTQEGKATTTSFTGTGLGLSIVKEIVELMGGTIELDSTENVGSTFRILLSLPLDKSHRESEKETERLQWVKVSGCRALLAEDNEINMEIAKSLLEEFGLEVTEAHNGQEAVELFRASAPNTFDYIFMDMMMPVMDGLEATRVLRALPRPDAKTVPIIAMTANAFLEDRRLCLEAGMNDHIGKPIDAQLLNRLIRQYRRPADG